MKPQLHEDKILFVLSGVVLVAIGVLGYIAFFYLSRAIPALVEELK